MARVARENSQHAEPSRFAIGSRWAGLCLLTFLCFWQTGCVHRRLTIRSDPPGALVLIDGTERGYTPYSMDFYYYGTHEIQLVKPGFETLTVHQKVSRPWYQYLPIEFFADNLWPHQTTNRNEFFYQMQPQVQVPLEDLGNRANGLRLESQIGP
ncbi:PEGA domain-containing protein [Thalassoroseus pseudoceratinae]|uniref:PEGA domain-containing protein n=1 Tax=Thalassoroseus pseudoceratinae TaxID=2713176 RepID=UPI001424689E|nr:PEGA domain-containing protein [Thalassoroseus pseudoceratinae]